MANYSLRLNSSVISLKLVIDLKDERVLFAEAGKDFVDFLFGVLSLPVAKLISLLVQGPNQDMLGSLSSMYKGLTNIGASSYQNHLTPCGSSDSSLVWPVLGVSIPLLGIKGNNIPDPPIKFHAAAVKYMVMDDLEVKPMSTSSWFNMMTTFDVKSVAALEERAVDMGTKEALNLLRASMKTKNVLTSVFLSSDNK